MEESELLLEVKGLKTHFFLDEGTVKAVEGVDFVLPRGGTLGIVGESGCGKTVTAYSITQLIESPGRIVAGQILFHRRLNGALPGSAVTEVVDLAKLRPESRQMCAIRGSEIAMVFQEPMTAFSPVHTIGDQISEVILWHRKVSKKEANEQTVEMLRRVGIPKAETRLDTYPFQFSGGMCQRAMIAMALVCRPSLLIADEPTTALDVTMQAQILELMQRLQREMGMAIMLITHNLGVVAEICDEVAVMYLGEMVEQASVDALFHDPLHPYTQALLRSIPKLGASKGGRLDPITGAVPDPYNRPTGCPFHPRCAAVISDKCATEPSPVFRKPDGRTVRCWRYA
ncbi:MAG TPA: ABC transporter ATP-binding protein [Anaerolineaceae bacterium]|jgi:peptide/nickel transport system ATP-binding protein